MDRLTDKYFDFIHDMEGVTDSEKKQIKRAIQLGLKQPSGRSGSKWTMLRAQTVAQLTVVAEKLISDAYRDKMYAGIQQYEHDDYEYQRKVKLDLAEAAYEIRMKFGPGRFDKDSAYSHLEKLQNETHHFYTQNQQFSQLYKNLVRVPAPNFLEAFENILAAYESDQRANFKSVNVQRLQQFQENLRNDWNSFASAFDQAHSYKVPTKEHSVLDIKL